MQPGEHQREHLRKFVWGSAETGSIDNALSELRSALGPEVIPLRARKVGINPSMIDVDALRLLAATADSDCAEAIELYRGTFLESFNARGCAESFVRWVEKTRRRLEEAFCQICDEACRAAAANGDWKRVASLAESGLQKSRGWAGGEQWRHLAEQALRVHEVDASCTEMDEKNVETKIGRDDPAAITNAVAGRRAALAGRPPRSSPRARAGAVMAGLLLVLTILVIRGCRGPIQLMQMPPIRADELPEPGSAINTLSDWLRTDGSWIYYRYERYMPAACRHPTVAVGNFGKVGWTRGTPVACLNSAWLAVDAQRLVDRFLLAPETTYCLQFLYIENGRSLWGKHGADGAPGLDAVRVVAPAGEYNIGFAVVRSAPGQYHVELTNRYPGPDC